MFAMYFQCIISKVFNNNFSSISEINKYQKSISEIKIIDIIIKLIPCQLVIF